MPKQAIEYILIGISKKKDGLPAGQFIDIVGKHLNNFMLDYTNKGLS